MEEKENEILGYNENRPVYSLVHYKLTFEGIAQGIVATD